LLRIALQPDSQLLTSGRYQSSSERWVERLREVGHEPRLVDASKPDFFDRVAGCDGFMWWYAHLAHLRNFAGRVVAVVEHGMGLPVFPSRETVWHFDDKVAQSYLLRAAGIPMPQTWIFWRKDEATEFCRSAARRLRTQSLAVDVLHRSGELVLVEISYYYESWLLHECRGRWELRGDPEGGRLDWVEGRMRPEDAILDDFLAGLEQRRAEAAPREANGAEARPAAAAG
jgi:hypothetical protein